MEPIEGTSVVPQGVEGGEAERVAESVAAAIGTLRRRERTIAEIRSWLLERGRGIDEVEEAVAQLVELGELDDERFAFAFADDKRALSGWGTERIEAALLERGIDAGLAERAAAAEYEEELDRAIELLVARRMALADEQEKTRALSYLTRRGYRYELAHDAIRRVGRSAGKY